MSWSWKTSNYHPEQSSRSLYFKTLRCPSKMWTVNWKVNNWPVKRHTMKHAQTFHPSSQPLTWLLRSLIIGEKKRVVSRSVQSGSAPWPLQLVLDFLLAIKISYFNYRGLELTSRSADRPLSLRRPAGIKNKNPNWINKSWIGLWDEKERNWPLRLISWKSK